MTAADIGVRGRHRFGFQMQPLASGDSTGQLFPIEYVVSWQAKRRQRSGFVHSSRRTSLLPEDSSVRIE